VDWKTDITPPSVYLEGMTEKVKIIEVALLEGDVLVTFADGRITRLDRADLHAQSIEAPPEPDRDIP
jgi:hypothetical protein